ncbi:MAG: 23S rRNA (adenine(2503)-C(2))-methyltransferase RlmN [Treponema sp.]|nr:23S rRNA (adenine(2503)-C(2))-methyltransferase RlmN [Treponema sp.]
MKNETALAGMLPAELEKNLLTVPCFRCAQIYKWITRGVCDFDQMTDIPVSMRHDLKTRFDIFSCVIDSIQPDRDADKIVLSLKDGLKIEAVLLSDGKKRFTACLSTQAGCPAGCVFCKTGSLGFTRNLTSGEITEQFLHLNAVNNLKQKSITGETGDDISERVHDNSIDNIVIMGMGEPLLNMAELRKAIEFFTDPEGLNISKRRITVSTCGICAGLYDIADNGPYIRLALSLTTADEPLRQRLMPVTAANPLKRVKDALIRFQKKGGGRVTLEIPLLGGLNTRSKDAASIARFAENLNAVINIIPWNPAAGLEFEGKPLREPSKKEIENFIFQLENQKLKVTMRHRKGRRAMAACGQLGSV